jgi:predicted RecB family endonuclease
MPARGGTRVIYTFQDADDAPLTIRSYPHHELGQVAAVRTGGTVFIATADIPAITDAMCEAAGARPLITLWHPGPAASGLGDELGDHVRVGHDGGSRVLLSIRGVSESLTPADAREVAAHLAARAGEADGQDEADMLHALILAAWNRSGKDGFRSVAREILDRFELTERAA